MSKRRCAVRRSISSSSGVSRSIKRVARFASLSIRATWRLRGLCLLLPLPCANSTTPRAFSGRLRLPSRVTGTATTRTRRSSTFGLVFAIVYTSLDSEGERLPDFARIPLGGALERFNRARFIEVEHGVKLVPQLRPKIVAHPLGLGQIN